MDTQSMVAGAVDDLELDVEPGLVSLERQAELDR